MDHNLDLEGKKYISAKRASEISGYNSDYLGQLCRSGKLECKLVSRTWFVTEESLRDHQNTNGRKKYGLRTHVVEEVSFLNNNQKILLDHERLENWKFKEAVNKKSFDKKLVFSIFLFIFISTISFVSVFGLKNNSYQENFAFNYVEKISSTLEGVAPKKFKVASLNLGQLKENFSNNYFALKNKIKIIALTIFNKEDNYLAQEVSISEKNKKSNFLPGDDNGAVMVPISSSEVSNISRVRNYLRDSFSDEVEILPDESGVSGVIKPVFSDPKDEEYFYVMVPVE